MFDPPHLTGAKETAWLVKKYGKLGENWPQMLRDGFRECMRVLKPDGVLIFKWSEYDIPAAEVWDAIGQKPLFGHHSGKQSRTFWACFISDYGRSMTAGELREWAAGRFGPDDRLYPSTLDARDFSAPAKLAEELGCSTDYLLGVTDHLAPAVEAEPQTEDAEPGEDGPWHWWPNQPTESGLYWCISGPLKSGGGLYWWNAEAEQWEHWGMSFRMTTDVVLWMRCPELPESLAWERQEVPDGEE